MPWKPEGYTSASPYLMVRDAEATLSFLETVFNARRLRVIPRDGGGIMHAEAMIDDSVVMMGEMPESVASHVHVYVKDVEAAFERARQAGGVVVQELKRGGDGDYRGGIADANGMTWWLARQDD